MFCPKCGRKNDDSVKFCGGCGLELSSISAPPPVAPVPSKPTPPVSPAPPKPISPVIPAPSKPVPPVKPFKPGKPAKEPKKAKDSSKDKSGKLTFTKDDAIRLLLWLGLAATYVAISWIFIMIFRMEETITVKSSYSSSFNGLLTLENLLELLFTGNRMFNATVGTKALAIGIEVFFYSVPVFAALSLASTIFSKKNFAFHITSSVISFVSSLLLILVVPVSTGLISGFKTALATRIGIVSDDIGRITYNPFVIYALAAVVLIAVSTVLSVLLNKRRNKK